MRYGFIKVCAATVPVRVADVQYNVDNILCAIEESYKNGSGITVFPELCVSGYTCGDLFAQSALLSAVESGLSRIKEGTKGKKALYFVGAPIKKDGKLYNCAVAFSNGKVLGVVPKTYIPNYGEFYERRHFSPAGSDVNLITFLGELTPFGANIIFDAGSPFTVSAEICEDLWAPESPSLAHAGAGANIIVNLSCSDETVGKAAYRKMLVKAQSGKLVSGYIYSDAGDGESTTDMAFAGHNLIAENGTVLAESKLFKNGLLYAEIDCEMLENERRRLATGYYSDKTEEHIRVEFELCDGGEFCRNFPRTPFVPEKGGELAERTELILDIQTAGLKQRLRHVNAKSAVVGVSGGLDSALALLVCRRAFCELGWDLSKIIAISMPGFGTTAKTKKNSLGLIEALGATGKIIPIKNSVLSHFKDIGHDPKNTDVTYENAQARMRTLVLMDTANQTGGLVIGTGDLSELALGWATYNGDHMSMYGVNCSVPKTLVKHLVKFEAERLGGKAEKFLNDILVTEISPELLPPDKNGEIAQKTEDIVGPYVLHDFFLYYIIRFGFSPEKVFFLAKKAFLGEFSEDEIKKWLKNFYKRFFANQFKRSCVPDGVKVGSVTLSPRGDWRMPSDAQAAVWLNEIDNL